MPFLTSTAYAATTQFRGDIGAMIVDSDPVVKLVLLTLLIFSVVSWAIIVQKWIVLSRSKKRGQKVLDAVRSSTNLAGLSGEIDAVGQCPLSDIYAEGRDELERITSRTKTIPMAMLTNVEGRIDLAGSKQTTALSGGLGFLASISNASPFIGLFGTVWGIMDSFREIGLMGSANLATVAPGISEALIATAAGLFVAIPAVLFYNYFTVTMSEIGAQIQQFEIDFMNWLRRGMLHGDE